MFLATQDTETIRIKIDPKVDGLRLYCCWAGKINWCQYNIYDQVIRKALIFRQSMRQVLNIWKLFVWVKIGPSKKSPYHTR
jgi:hypothetical protein